MEFQAEIIAELDRLGIGVDLATDWERTLLILQYGDNHRDQEFPSILKRMELIEQLTIRNSQWTSLPKELTDLRNVGRLRLVMDEVTSVEGIEDMDQLLSVGLYMSKLTKLPREFGKLDKLKFLAIKAPLQSLPDSLLEIGSLQTVYFDEVKFGQDEKVAVELSEDASVRFTSFPTP